MAPTYKGSVFRAHQGKDCCGGRAEDDRLPASGAAVHSRVDAGKRAVDPGVDVAPKLRNTSSFLKINK
jgi:hypothetical protein